jgi:nucleoside-diphosphate-sugar epimerase
MARVLIVGCGCRGRDLAAALIADGHAVRATTRDPANTAAIAATGAEAVTADPDRLGTVTAQLQGVSVLCWPMGSATGASEQVAALHGPRLRSLLEALVDTHVRGFVYEAAGSVDRALLAQGAAMVREAGTTYRMPVEVVDADPCDGDWPEAMRTAVARALAA